MKSYFRPEIDAMKGYVPGEQPKIPNLIKLNTNENPYPPSPRVREALRTFDFSQLRLYPDPSSDALRDAIAAEFGVSRENVIAGNGSDDILTMTFRRSLRRRSRWPVWIRAIRSIRNLRTCRGRR